MKVKRILTGLLLIVLSMTLLAVSVSAYSFFVGTKVVNAELVVDSSTATSATAAVYSNYYLSMSVSLTGTYYLNDGTIQGTGNGGGATGYSA